MKFSGVNLYIPPLYANSAMADAFPMNRVFKKVNFSSSLKEAASTVLQNWPNYSCHWSGLPLFWVSASFPEEDPSLRLTMLGPYLLVSRLAAEELDATKPICCQEFKCF